MSTCAPDSPERRGQIGCTVFPSKPLPEGRTWYVSTLSRYDGILTWARKQRESDPYALARVEVLRSSALPTAWQ